jgi:hypothetical protein
MNRALGSPANRGTRTEVRGGALDAIGPRFHAVKTE